MATKKKMLQAAAGSAGGAGGFTAIEDVFSTYLYTGNDGVLDVTNNIDLAGEGGMIWHKARTPYSGSNTGTHTLWSSETVGNLNSTNTDPLNNVELQPTFNSDGYTFPTSSWVTLNSSLSDYVGWTFRKAPRFFDCVTYTGTGSAQAIAHNLGVAPGCVIVKCTSAANAWTVYHRGVNGGSSPEGYALNLGADSQQDAATAYWNSTAPTDTQFTVGTTARTNASGGTYVAYLFAHDPLGPSEDGSDGLIACGSYTGDGTTDGSKLVNIGWEPQWLLIKNTTRSENWLIIDSMRGASYDNTTTLFANLSQADATSGREIWTMDPQGFRLSKDNSDSNQSGDNYIYIAIRRGPMRVPESGTEVFDIDTWGGTSPTPPTFVSGFPVDFSFYKNVTDGSNNWSSQNRLTGYGDLAFNATSAEFSNNGTLWQKDYMNGIGSNTSTISTGHMWMFRRAPGFFDVVAYTGNGTAGRTVPHNLGVAPEMLIFKRRDATRNWAIVHHEAVNRTVNQPPVLTGYDVSFNFNVSGGLGGVLNSTAPTSSIITLSSSSDVNVNAGTYIAYLFATLPGISKCGSYTGNGSNQTINCGFTSGARFILIKRCDDEGDWYVWDTARGIVTGNDPFLELNTTDAEVTSDDSIDPDSSGFIVNQTATTNVNVSSASYIFLAIA